MLQEILIIFKKITGDDGNEADNPKYDANKVGKNETNEADNPKYDGNKVRKNETEVAIPLKHLSNSWRSLNIPLINCEVEMILTWSKSCVMADMTTKDAEGGNPDTRFFVPLVTLSKENDIKLLEQLKSGFKRTIKWNKYRSQMTI